MTTTTVHTLMLEGGRATITGRPCKFTITGNRDVLVELDDPAQSGAPDGRAIFTARLDELDDVVWNFPDTGAVRILALEGVRRHDTTR